MKHEFHTLKSWGLFFDDIAKGIRTSDIRFTDDRRFHVGDTLELRRWDPVKGVYTGEKLLVEITYIQTNKSNPCAISPEAIADNVAVLSIKKIGDVYTDATINSQTLRISEGPTLNNMVWGVDQASDGLQPNKTFDWDERYKDTPPSPSDSR